MSNQQNKKIQALVAEAQKAFLNKDYNKALEITSYLINDETVSDIERATGHGISGAILLEKARNSDQAQSNSAKRTSKDNLSATYKEALVHFMQIIKFTPNEPAYYYYAAEALEGKITCSKTDLWSEQGRKDIEEVYNLALSGLSAYLSCPILSAAYSEIAYELTCRAYHMKDYIDLVNKRQRLPASWHGPSDGLQFSLN